MAQTDSFKKSIDQLNYTDFYYRGYQANQEFILRKNEAIKNALKLYLFSQKGDYGREVEKGGPLIEFLGKPINPQTENDLRESIVNVVSTFENIIVNEVLVVGDPEGKGWSIKVTFSDIYNKFTDSLNMGL